MPDGLAHPCRPLGRGPPSGEGRVRGGRPGGRRVRARHHGRSPGSGEDARSWCGDAVTVIELPLDDSWFRDSAPLFVLDGSGRRAGVDFRFNAWGGKHAPFDSDDRVSALLLDHLAVERIPSDMILEGGAVTVDGEGTLITTEQCLLHPNRNPGMSRQDIEAELKARLGVTKVIWLPYGGCSTPRPTVTSTESAPSRHPARSSSRSPRTPYTPTTPGCGPTGPCWRPRATPRGGR